MEVVGDNVASSDLANRIATILREGGLVVLPTETVYGVAARADSPKALEALKRLKGRPQADPLTWHVAGLDSLERFPRVSPMALRLADRYWPGPLTLILPGVPAGLESIATGGWTGVRAPAHPATHSLLEALDFPVVMTSANPHGEAPALDAESAARWCKERVDLLLDGGRCRMAEASTILKLGPGHFELLREGPIDLAALRRCAGLKLAFVCTGNTCRSPMAQMIATKAIADRLKIPLARLPEFGFAVSSMGAYAGHGMPAAEHSIEVMRREGLDLSGHGSTPLTRENAGDADRIYGLTRSHVAAATDVVAGAEVQLLDPDGGDVPDPIGGTLEDYIECSLQIRSLIERRLDEWV